MKRIHAFGLVMGVLVSTMPADGPRPAAAAPLHAASAAAFDEVGITLSGSRASMLRQNHVARTQSYTFLRTPTQVLRFVDDGYLDHLAGSADYHVIARYPYARPAVRTFIERVAADYRAACGEQLVVTSLTRPSTRQPGNASPLSVHPAGMAVDLRVSARGECVDWLSAELLRLEERGLIDATREYRPPHFHIAVFPEPWLRYDQTKRAEADAAESIRRLERAADARRMAAEAARHAAAIRPDTPAGPSVLVRLAVAVARVMLPLPA